MIQKMCRRKSSDTRSTNTVVADSQSQFWLKQTLQGKLVPSATSISAIVLVTMVTNTTTISV